MITTKSILKEKILNKDRVRKNVLNKYSKNKKLSFSYGLCFIIIILLITYFSFNNIAINDNNKNYISDKNNDITDNSGNDYAGIMLPKNMVSINGTMDIANNILIYNGKTYASLPYIFDFISYDDGLKIMDEKLGVTNEIINDYGIKRVPQEFDSTFDKNVDIYSVKGYSSDFRIMVIGNIWGQNRAVILESIEGINIKYGSDIISLLNLENNVNYIEIKNNLNEQTYKKLNLNNEFKIFINFLKTSTPIIQDEKSYLASLNNFGNMKFFEVKLKDNTNTRFYVYQDGYIRNREDRVIFRVEDEKSFINFYNNL